MSTRALMFVAVGAAGFAVQMAVLWLLTEAGGWPLAPATLVAVEAAVLHNFAWHERWTWRQSAKADHWRHRLWRFHAGTAATSLAGNIAVTAALVSWLRVPLLAANACAVGVTSVANFAVADRWVFRPPRAAPLVVALTMALWPGAAHAGQPAAETTAAWHQYTHAVEATLSGRPWPAAGSGPEGRSTHVPGGIVHEWRGTRLVRGVSVQALVRALENPGLPPPADDILDARVLERAPSGHLRVFMRVTRSTLVTVTYDTVHDVTFAWTGADSAVSRSTAVSIHELGGTDHGFLWALQSYWRYQQVGPDVRVDLLSLSLSRDVPSFLRPVAAPIVDHVARESVERALDAVDLFGRSLPAAPAGPSVAGRAHVDANRAEARTQPGRQ